MVALNFKAEFADAVEDGVKCRTIRQHRKAGNPSAGDRLQLYTGMRTKSCRKLLDAICTRVRSIEIDHLGVVLAGRPLFGGNAPAYLGGVQPEQYDGDFAMADGFDSFTDMVNFFEKQYGLPFKGQLIQWRAVTNGERE
jgi:hypothetical protein